MIFEKLGNTAYSLLWKILGRCLASSVSFFSASFASRSQQIDFVSLCKCNFLALSTGEGVFEGNGS